MRYHDTIMEAERVDGGVTVTFYRDDQGRREAAKVVRTYCRTVRGHVTAHATFIRRTVQGDAFTYRYRLTEV